MAQFKLRSAGLPYKTGMMISSQLVLPVLIIHHHIVSTISVGTMNLLPVGFNAGYQYATNVSNALYTDRGYFVYMQTGSQLPVVKGNIYQHDFDKNLSFTNTEMHLVMLEFVVQSIPQRGRLPSNGFEWSGCVIIQHL